MVLSLCGIGISVAVYFLLKPYIGNEILSWISIVCAAPFAVLAFAKYNGMNAERFIFAYLKYRLFSKKKLKYSPRNVYYDILKEEDIVD